MIIAICVLETSACDNLQPFDLGFFMGFFHNPNFSVLTKLALLLSLIHFCPLPAKSNESAKSLETKGLREEALNNDKEALKYYERALLAVPPGDFDTKVRLLSNTAIGYLKEKKQVEANRKIDEALQVATHLPAGKSLSEYTLLNFGNLSEAINTNTPWSDKGQRDLQIKRIQTLLTLTELSWKDKRTLVDKQIGPIRVLVINGNTSDTIRLLNDLLASPQADAVVRRRIKYLIAATQYRIGQKAPLLVLEKSGMDKQSPGDIYVSITQSLDWACDYLPALSFAEKGLKRLEALNPKSAEDHYDIYQIYDIKAGIYANLGRIDDYDHALHQSIKALDGVPQYANKQRKSTEFLANKLKEQKKIKELAALCKERHIDSAAFSENWLLEFEKDHLLKK